MSTSLAPLDPLHAADAVTAVLQGSLQLDAGATPRSADECVDLSSTEQHDPSKVVVHTERGPCTSLSQPQAPIHMGSSGLSEPETARSLPGDMNTWEQQVLSATGEKISRRSGLHDAPAQLLQPLPATGHAEGGVGNAPSAGVGDPPSQAWRQQQVSCTACTAVYMRACCVCISASVVVTCS